jgi:hypothetical protein
MFYDKELQLVNLDRHHVMLHDVTFSITNLTKYRSLRSINYDSDMQATVPTIQGMWMGEAGGHFISDYTLAMSMPNLEAQRKKGAYLTDSVSFYHTRGIGFFTLDTTTHPLLAAKKLILTGKPPPYSENPAYNYRPHHVIKPTFANALSLEQGTT